MWWFEDLKPIYLTKVVEEPMYTAVNGIYEDGHLTLTERPPTTRRSRVVVLFLDEQKEITQDVASRVGVSLGSLEGKYSIPDDFNEPLDDLNDYV